MFQVEATDLAGRKGRLKTKHGSIDTPVILPVIHPVRQEIPCSKIRSLGFPAVMTNAYVTYKKYGAEAERRGIHDIIGFDGVVMTDSGGYQVLEYGKVDVTPIQIAKFQEAIGSDIAITLDRPTGLKATEQYAERTIQETYLAAKESMRTITRDGVLWSGPVQGGIHYSLVERSSRLMSRLNFDMYALGSPTEILESYEFLLLVEMIMAAKKNLPLEAPLHLFGAGHPLTMSLAVALGCDIFDSASYILYAKGDRYMTEYGTAKLRNLQFFACSCETCLSYTPEEVRSLKKQDRTEVLALHNLQILSKEVRSVHEAMEEGRLWEYTGIKARSHPAMWRAFRAMGNYADFLEDGTPTFKERGIFLHDPPDDRRPEVVRSANSIIQNIEFPRKKSILVVFAEKEVTPFYNTSVYRHLSTRLTHLISKAQVSFLLAPFGLIPVEISDVYPFSQYVSSLELSGEVEEATITRALELINSWGPRLTVFFDDDGPYSRIIRKLASKIHASEVVQASEPEAVTEALTKLLR